MGATADAWYRRVLTNGHTTPQVVTERTWDGAEICVDGLTTDCSVTATIRASQLRITAIRDGAEQWSRRYELPDGEQARVKDVRWDGKLVRVALRLP